MTSNNNPFAKLLAIKIAKRAVHDFTQQLCDIQPISSEPGLKLTNTLKHQQETYDAIRQRLHDWLGSEGIAHFQYYRKTYGTVTPVYMLKGADGMPDIPHPVHFREGMQVRNFLRTLPECKDWTTFDFDDNWAQLVEYVITYTGPKK